MKSDMLTAVKGLEISYQAHGLGPTLVLIHAFPLNKSMWEPQIEALSERCHVVTLDLRGFGASQTCGSLFSIEDLADDVHDLLEQLGYPYAVVGGISMGGYVAMAYARRYPQTLRGLILADTRAGKDTPEARTKRMAMIDAVEAEGSEAIAGGMLGTLLSPAVAKARPELVKTLFGWIETAEPQAVTGALRAMANRLDSTDALGELHIPTLILVGEQDALSPPSEAEAMARTIAGAKLVTIPQAGHLPNLENSQAFNAAVLDFMRQFAD